MQPDRQRDLLGQLGGEDRRRAGERGGVALSRVDIMMLAHRHVALAAQRQPVQLDGERLGAAIKLARAFEPSLLQAEIAEPQHRPAARFVVGASWASRSSAATEIALARVGNARRISCSRSAGDEEAGADPRGE